MLEVEGLGDAYPYAYLTINGRLGHQLYWQKRKDITKPDLRDIADIQIYDPAMNATALSDQRKALVQNEIFNKWATDGASVDLDVERGDFDAELFGDFRQRVRRFHDRIETVRRSMTAPIVTYTREGFTRTWPHISALDSDMEQSALENGNIGIVVSEVQRETEEVRERQRHVLQGAHILYALTASGRERAGLPA